MTNHLSRALADLERAIKSTPLEPEAPEPTEAPPAERRVVREVVRDKDNRIKEVIETDDTGAVTRKKVERDRDHRVVAVLETHVPAPPSVAKRADTPDLLEDLRAHSARLRAEDRARARAKATGG